MELIDSSVIISEILCHYSKGHVTTQSSIMMKCTMINYQTEENPNEVLRMLQNQQITVHIYQIKNQNSLEKWTHRIGSKMVLSSLNSFP